VKASAAQRLLLSTAAAALLLVVLFALGNVHPGQVLRALVRLPPGVYLAALGLHLATYALRALRFQLLLPSDARPRFRQALAVAAAHNLASYVLPFKAGEASLVLYLKLQAGTPAPSALAALLVARFLDGASLCAGMAAACFTLRARGAGSTVSWLAPASGLLVVLALLFLVLSLRGDLLVRGIGRPLRWMRVGELGLGRRLLERADGLALALRAASGRRRLLGAALTTAPMWFTIFGFYALLAGALGIPAEVSFLERAFGASLATLFNLLPVNAAAGLGTQELGWVTGFHVVLGVDERLALTSGVSVHFVQLFNIVMLGFLAHLAMGVLPRRRTTG
jgi:uncharacterized protein (TIRG00374 family)